MEAALVVLAWLAEGAVTYLGGQLMKNVLGNPDLNDIESVIRAAITAINAATRQAIDENEIRKLVASMQAIMRNLKDYAELQTLHDQLANEFLLTDAILRTGDAVAQCATLGLPAIFCYGYSVSLNLLSRAAYYKLTSTSDAKRLVNNMVDSSSVQVNKVVVAYITLLNPDTRLGVPNPPCEWESPYGDPNGTPGRCWVTIDGQMKMVFDGIGPIDDGDYNNLVDQSRAQLEQIRTDAVATIQVPMKNAVDAWHRMRTAIQLT